jgi:predicted DNA-binding transcriptional regulator AlpA
MALLLTKEETSAELSISTSTLERWVAQGIVPKPLRIGGLVRWKYEDIKACVADMGNASAEKKEPVPQKKRGRPRLAN